MKLHIFLFLFLTSSFCFAQSEIPSTLLPLDDMSAFKNQAGNWQIAGDVNMDYTRDIHDKGKNPVARTAAGKGILVNLNDEKRKDNLVTNFEHGDLEIEFDFMMPKGSNSGFYLQGRYEVQLFDSWGETQPKFSDLGGVYRNWETETAKVYMGKAPAQNAAKAPGLWQHLKINFQAPKFEVSGRKIANARLKQVTLNGVVIHDNVELPLYTGGAIENNEKPTGPILIQGDHGAVAFRNIRYRAFKSALPVLSNLQYNYYEGSFKTSADFLNGKPVRTGKLKDFTWDVGGEKDKFGLLINGTLTVPENGDYFFTSNAHGGSQLMINNEKIIDGENSWTGSGKIKLNAGAYPFVFMYHKDESWAKPSVFLSVESATTPAYELQGIGANADDTDPVNPILLRTAEKPTLLRAFYDYHGDRKLRKTHTIATGDASQLHYLYDLKAGNLLGGWRGDFLDATPMWHDRGDGSFRPMGSLTEFSDNPPLQILSNANANWISAANESNFRSNGYELEPSGKPVFKYTYSGVEVQDKIRVENKMLVREVNFTSAQKIENLYYKIAEGKDAVLMPDGSYLMDDKRFYIKILDNNKPIIREGNGKKEMLVLVNNTQMNIKYALIF
jgi:hypothetical protein